MASGRLLGHIVGSDFTFPFKTSSVTRLTGKILCAECVLKPFELSRVSETFFFGIDLNCSLGDVLIDDLASAASLGRTLREEFTSSHLHLDTLPRFQ